MGLDLGRVQGAGWFHTSAASSTSINVSSLQPQLTPFVGDAVLFPNGDVRQIIGVSGSTVTLGDVLYSVKGDPGIGNATLSNTDGDSTENGFTQQAVKGIAQAKNYYNQAVCDSSVSNSDGTTDVPRKTGVYRLDGSEAWTGRATARGIVPIVNIAQLPMAGLDTSYNFLATAKTNLLPVSTENNVYSGTRGISFQQMTHTTQIHIRLTELVGYSSNEEAVNAIKNYLGQHPLYIQYEHIENYQYTEKVIENQPIRLANQEEEWYWHEEWRKGLNVFNFNDSHSNAGVTGQVENNIVTLNGTNVIKENIIEIVNFKLPNPNKTYNIHFTYLSGTVSADYRLVAHPVSWSTQQHVFLKNGGIQGSFIDLTGNEEWRIDLYSPTDMTGATLNEYKFSIMTVEGTHPYPYQPYNGELVHEIDLSSVQLFPEGVNPAQTIGGDWEDKGTVTTSDNTVFHAYRRLS